MTSSSRWLCARMYFFFNDTATTEIYTLSLHDALPISHHRHRPRGRLRLRRRRMGVEPAVRRHRFSRQDRKSTRLNSSHANISYAVFCLKKKLTLVLDGLDGTGQLVDQSEHDTSHLQSI